jgi:hypothetical protein
VTQQEENRRRFLEALIAASAPGAASLEERTKTLRHELLWYGSATPDNREAARRLSVGEAENWGAHHLGVTLASSGALASDVLNAAEGCPMPEGIAEWYPNLRQEDWDAVLRLATLTLLTLEGPILD